MHGPKVNSPIMSADTMPSEGRIAVPRALYIQWGTMDFTPHGIVMEMTRDNGSRVVTEVL